MTKKYNIEEIIAGCRQGNPLYQRALVNDYSELLFAVAYRYVGNETLAKDVLQEAYIRIFKSFGTFDENKGALTTWMRKVTVNAALRQLQKKFLKTSSLTLELNEKFHTSPEAIQKMTHDEIMEVVSSLPEGYRQVFNLNVIEGYSHREISTMLNIQEVTSRSKLSRAKQMLRNKLSTFKNSDIWIKTI